MKTLCFKCTAGVSGDMCVGALLDVGGFDDAFIVDELSKLNLDNYMIDVTRVDKAGVQACKFNVRCGEEKAHRHLPDIMDIIESSALNDHVKSLSICIFQTLAEAEAKVHDVDIHHVHFHEVGAIDSIVDIVAAAILLDTLAPERVIVGRISVGRGRIAYSHGTTTLPVPAVREILCDIPQQVVDVDKELTTPTGAAILRTVATDFADETRIQIEKTGYGAGTRDLPFANVLEVTLGQTECHESEILHLTTNIDDMNPEFYEYVIDRLLREGARDAYVQPCQMKKNRLGVVLNVLCKQELKEHLLDILFDETTTFGVRINQLSRVEMERSFETVTTPYGVVKIKLGEYKGRLRTLTPEYEDCRKLAREKQVPLRKVYEQAHKIAMDRWEP